MSRNNRHKKPSYARRHRHADIMRLMKQSDGTTNTQTALKQRLSAVNATGFLADFQRRTPTTRHVYGPKHFQGDAWAGVIVWMKAAGYHGYKTLTLIGVWALQAEETAVQTLIVGVRYLTYNVAFYNPEAYFHQIKRDFRPYYGKDASPPQTASGQLYRVEYTPEKRLVIRKAIDSALHNYTTHSNTI